jgi:hypothetical protein
MEQAIQMVLLYIWDFLADFLGDKYVLLWLGLLFVIGSTVNRGVNRLAEAQCDLAAGLEAEFNKLSDKLESLEGIITVDSLMAGIHGHIGHEHGESNGEATRRWLAYRVDDALEEALEELLKESKRTADQPDES